MMNHSAIERKKHDEAGRPLTAERYLMMAGILQIPSEPIAELNHVQIHSAIITPAYLRHLTYDGIDTRQIRSREDDR